jgi:hypothetical protein
MCRDERGRINRREGLSVGWKEGRVTVYRGRSGCGWCGEYVTSQPQMRLSVGARRLGGPGLGISPFWV